MSGEEFLPELRKIRPEVKVLVSSGYSETETMALFHGTESLGVFTEAVHRGDARGEGQNGNGNRSAPEGAG